MPDVPSGPWERRPVDQPERRPPRPHEPYTPAQVPLFPGQEDATVLIQRITDEADTHSAEDVPAADTGPAADIGPVDDTAADRSAEPVMRTDRTSGVVRAGAMMAVATLASRITGFIAKALLLAVLGVSIVSDSYNVANTLPNIVFELVIGGVLTSVAIPLLSRARSDPDGGELYTQRLVTTAFVGLIAVSVLAVLAAPLFTAIYVSGGDQADPQLTTQLARLLLPQILFYGMAALFGAILNTKERFAAPAWAPLVNNLVVIGIAVAVSTAPGGVFGPEGAMVGLSATQLWLLGLGTTAGIFAQAAVMLPSLLRSGFRFRWRWGGDRRLLEAGGLMLWSIGYALTSAISFVITTRVFTDHFAGGVSVYAFASMLFQLPYGILGVSVLTAIMPRMSRHAAAGAMEAVKDDASLANRLSTIALLPVAAAMVVLSGPLAMVTTGYGNVSADSSQLIGWTLGGLALGLVPLAVTLVQMRVFYAMKDGRTPTVINAVMVGVRIPLVLYCSTLRVDLIAPGIAVATTVSYLVGAVVGEIWLRARFGPMGSSRLLVTLGKMLLASAGAAAVAWYVVRLVDTGAGGTVYALALLALGGVVGLLVLIPLMLLLRIREVDPVRRRLAAMLGFRAAIRAVQVAPSSGQTTSGTVPAGSDRQEPAAVADDSHEGAGDDRPGSAHPVSGEEPEWDEALDEDVPRVPHPPADHEPDAESDTEAGAEAGPGPDAEANETDKPDGADGAADTDEADGETVLLDPLPPTAGRSAQQPDGERRPLAPGASIGGRYRLVSEVAVDSAGNHFWRARDTVLPRDMAITMLPDSSGTSATVARTLRAGRLQHIGLPQTLDLGTDHGQTFVVGQWVDGATLTDLLARGPLEPEVAISIAGRISAAVAEAHRNGLALGSISPSLVRVNVDGQVRFSHVIAHAAATPDQDIRAVGGLLYLMLTGTWPASDQLPSVQGADLRAAPTAGGRELPANEVNREVPSAVAAVAERALHPEDPDGIHAVGALATLLRTPDSSPPATSGSPAEPEPPPPTMSPADRRLRRERRVKLGIAASFLAAFVALILIVVATLANNVLAGLNEFGQGDLTPFASESLGNAATPTTAPPATSGGGTSGGEESTSGGQVTSTSSSAPATSSSKPPDTKLTIVGAEVYDPEGQGEKDYVDLTDRTYDGDPNTEWLTWVYFDQFKPKAEGGYKVGVGLVLQFDKPVRPHTVEVTTSTPGMTVQIRSASAMDPGPFSNTQLLGSGDVGTGPAAIPVTDAPQSEYLLVFLSKIPPVPAGSGEDQSFQGRISEIVVKGS